MLKLFPQLERLPVARTDEAALRLREVENALLSQLYRGKQPTTAALKQLECYVQGTVSREEGFRELYFPAVP